MPSQERPSATARAALLASPSQQLLTLRDFAGVLTIMGNRQVCAAGAELRVPKARGEAILKWVSMGPRRCLVHPLWVAISPVRHASYCSQALRLVHALPGRLLAPRPPVSGAPLPPPASPTVPACKRPMTARPCPSPSLLPSSLCTALTCGPATLSLGVSRPAATRPASPTSDWASRWLPPSIAAPCRTSIGGGDDEDRAPIDDRFDGLSRGVEAVAVPTAVEAGALLEPWCGGRRRGAGPGAHTGEQDGRRVAGAVLGRVFRLTLRQCAVVSLPSERKTHVTDVCMVN